jgi:immune inhibitor A
MKSKRFSIVIIALGIVVLCCCLVLLSLEVGWLIFGSSGGLFPQIGLLNSGSTATSNSIATNTQTMVPVNTRTSTPQRTLTPLVMISPTPVATNQPASSTAFETLNILEAEAIPTSDLRDLAQRLEGKMNIPETVAGNPPNLHVGDTQQFWVSNVDTNENFQVSTRLEYVTSHVYFWVQNGVQFVASDLRRIVEAFESEIYPTDREFFGSEWTPGVDNDVHLYILYIGGLGNSLGGYYSSTDEVNPLAQEFSNAHELFVFNSDNSYLNDDYTYGILAHEFQHMIQWYQDRNESTWLNEGFSELAVLLNGYTTGYMDSYYAYNPDMQLTYWPPSIDDATSNYGASFLFTTYFLSRFGEENTKMLVDNPENGLKSIDQVFEGQNIQDPDTGEVLTANEFFRDWTLANFLQDATVGDGRYTYNNYDQLPTFRESETINDCQTPWQSRTVHQFGVDYIHIACNQPFTFSFQGDSEIGVVPYSAHSGNYFFWSNKGDESDMSLTRTFDFSNTEGSITLNYWTWYDLEEDYDYVYLEVSDDGESWQILTTPSCTTDNPSGNSYGCGYNSISPGWIQEHVDLSNYSGKIIQIRFEYITDAGVNGNGFMLDDVSIPEVGYNSDFEFDDGGWSHSGFVRIQNSLPQTFLVTLILRGSRTQVEELILDSTQSLTRQIIPPDGTSDITLIVSGVTPSTFLEASYGFRLTP